MGERSSLGSIVRILITGGFGLIGGRLGQFLQQRGHQIILASRNVHNSPKWLPKSETIKIDWSNRKSIIESCMQVDAIIHAAGMNARDCVKDPISALEVNGVSTAHMVNAAIKNNVSYFIYLSTAHVYGSPLSGVITENTCPRNLHSYATSHLAGENVLLEAIRAKKIKGNVLRLSNAFGVPSHKNVNCRMLLVNDLCQQAVEKNKMVLRSSGIQHRDFLTITDVCRSIEYLLYSRAKSQPIINIGSGITQSIVTMTKLIQNRCKVVFNTSPQLYYLTASNSEENISFKYRTKAITEMGFIFSNRSDIEIDGLLKRYKIWFSS